MNGLSSARRLSLARFSAIGMAVALAAPAVFVSASFAADNVLPVDAALVALVAQDATGPKAVLAAAAEQVKAGQYEEAAAALSGVDSATLDDADKATHAELVKQADTAVAERRDARASFETGEQALAAKDYVAAEAAYRAAVDNQYADQATKDKAKEQWALAEAGMKKSGTAAAPAMGPSDKQMAKDAYRMGKEQYRKGDWIAARQNLQKARDLGYKPGLFEGEKPEKYLAVMDKKEQSDASKAANEYTMRAEMTQPVQPEGTPVDPTAPDATAAAPTTGPAALPGSAGNAGQTEVELTQLANSDKIQAEQKAFQARRLVDQAKAALSGSRREEAISILEEATRLDPANTEASDLYSQALAAQGTNPINLSLADRQQVQITARRDAISFAFDVALRQSETALQKDEFNEARAALARAEAASKQDPGIFTNDEINSFNARLATQRVQLVQTEDRIRNQELADANVRATNDANERSRIEAENRRRAIQQLIADSRRLTEQGRYAEAVKVVDQILINEPRNDYARGVRPLLLDRRNLALEADLRRKLDENTIEVLNQTTEKTIPYSDILSYPPDWPNLSARREATVAQERGSGVDATAGGILEKVLPELRFNDVAFADVIDFLRDSTGANIFVNWKVLEENSIDRNTPITIRLRNAKFSKVLKLILESVGGGTVALSYTVDDGVITISTADDLAKNVETLTYDIRDLIINIPDFTEAPDFNLDSQNGQNGGNGGGNGGGGGGGGGQGLFGNQSNGQGGDEEEEGPTREELVTQITQLIQDTIASDSWKDNGGTIGSLRELGGQLIVTQTPENHSQIVSLLGKLRETRAIQVNIEARFLTVQRNFLEDVGVDFDFAFNVNNDSIARQNVGAIGVTPVDGTAGPFGPTRGLTPVVVNQNSSSFTAVNNLTTSVPGNLGRALGTGSPANLSTQVTAFLDDFQASLLVRATQVNQSVVQLTAPRVTLFNGQRAYVLVARQVAYVSDLTPIVGQNAVGFDPTIDSLQVGVVLDVSATVSADRKYVTLTLRPQLSTLNELTSFTVFGGQTTDGGLGGGGTTTTTGTIQRPDVQITEVRTSVSVPDGGTLLLGGQTLSGEISRESGVPVLSKVPFLKRLFTNRSSAKDESMLLILVKPTIIIQREVEQTNFPILSSRSAGN